MTDIAQKEFYRQLGASIRKHRQKRKLSQEALADLIGLKRTSLTNIENGRQHPPLHTFCAIVKHLEAELSDMLPDTSSTVAVVDLKTLAGSQLHGSNEFAFVQTGIGIKGKGPNGNQKKENSGDRRRTSR